MRERPILFSGAMVRAILAGKKTQTRRVVRPQPPADHPFAQDLRDGSCWWNDQDKDIDDLSFWPSYEKPARCPFGQPGDRLWVRETTINVEDHGYVGPVYACDSDVLSEGLRPHPDDMREVEPEDLKLRPAIHMRREYSRITLELTKVHVERVQDITAEGALAEGCERWSCGHPDCAEAGHYGPRGAFYELWDKLNKGRGFGWELNPWVWVLEFRSLSLNIGASAGAEPSAARSATLNHGPA